MADLGFLPAVRRLLDATPRGGQRMLFSATLDAGVQVLVKRFLDHPVTHEADSEQSPVATMAHHVLHVEGHQHLPVLLDLVAAPGRTVVFTRTKHRARSWPANLNASGVPAVELHGNLSQNARTRTMDAFHSGAAQTLVATWTSPPAASTSTMSPSWSTRTRRSSTRPICTGPVARREPATRARS